jgi:hypothetical protein
MISVLTAFTCEIDDGETAAKEILEQLDLDANLLANSVGIIHTHADFIETGTLRAVSQALPFPTLGTTVIAIAVPGTSEERELLSVTVLTSDDVEFGVGLGDPLVAENTDKVVSGWTPATANLIQPPALAIVFSPLTQNASGDFIVKSIDAQTGGVPLFGMMAVDHTLDYHLATVIYDGEVYKDRLAILAIAGDIHPKFYLAGISRQKLFRETGTVTKSEANRLYEVNDAPVSDFLKSIGMPVDADGNIIPASINAHPFILDYGDGGDPVVRVMFTMSDDGAAICGGDVPVGSTLTIGFIDDNSVIETTSDLLPNIEVQGSCDVAIAASCVGRFYALGYEPFREANIVQKSLGKTTQGYEFSYVGGEICPVYLENGTTVNRFHNDTIVVCTF